MFDEATHAALFAALFRLLMPAVRCFTNWNSLYSCVAILWYAMISFPALSHGCPARRPTVAACEFRLYCRFIVRFRELIESTLLDFSHGTRRPGAGRSLATCDGVHFLIEQVGPHLVAVYRCLSPI